MQTDSAVTEAEPEEEEKVGGVTELAKGDLVPQKEEEKYEVN